MKIERFEDLDIWNGSIELATEIYCISNNEKFIRDFALQDQIRRAVISISANIVEGFEKNNNNEFIRFLKIAKGSCGELRSHLVLAEKIGHIKHQEFSELEGKAKKMSSQIASLITYLIKQRSLGHFKKK